jgi:urea transport system substrate-binding protein
MKKIIIISVVVVLAITGTWLYRNRNLLLGEAIKVGILHSLTGTMAISEKSVVDSTLMAIEEINQQGGILGRKIEPVVVD